MAQQPDNTSKLFDTLFKASDLKDFMKDHEDKLTAPLFHAHIAALCRDRNERQEAVINRACIERTYGHQLFNGTRRPSRDKVIQLAFGFGMGLEDAQRLLKVAQYSQLYPKIKRDAVIIYCLNKKKSIFDAQAMLEELELKLLGDEKKNG